MNKKKRYSVLLLLREKDIFCLKFLKLITLNCKKVDVFWSNKHTKKIEIKKKYDFIISYRCSVILKNKDILKAKVAAINLHPGPPKYRGIGCLNYALYNNEKKYGFTIHFIKKKVDFGRILFVKYFSVKKNNTVSTLLEETHRQCIKYSQTFFKDILNDETKLDFYIKKFKKEKWSKTIRTRKKLDEFYRIKNFNLKEINRKIRATYVSTHKPFIQLGKNKFYLK